MLDKLFFIFKCIFFSTRIDLFFFIFQLANLAQALPGKLNKHYKGTHLDILRFTKFSLP